ncbi:TIGR01620 family protein [Vibrio sp. S11_S32]|uniref:YcjF family protein n=1 Tax=Vibrio sp. S11_S32 TaxID=2720225 RepID=UPI0016812DC0|nr:TIGR01620 family protein [Vibrio sp. S11_S32]MBD1576999.1 TIGR01620 family protein [Vibrio sp. S11_S32]
MSEYKSKQVFSTDKADVTPKSDKREQNQDPRDRLAQATQQTGYVEAEPLGKLNASLHFNDQVHFNDHTQFTPMTLEQQAASDNELALEEKIVAVIRPKGKRRIFWSLGGLSFSGLLGWQCVDNVLTAYQTHDWLSLGWSALIASAASFGIAVTLKELWKLRRLGKQLSHQEKAMDMMFASPDNKASHASSYGKAVPFCESIAQEAGITLEHVGFDRWKTSVTANHNDADVIELYDAMVVSVQDQKAKKLVANYACEAAVLVAISPLAIADMALIAWRNFKLIDELGKIYGVELGYFSRLRLVKLVFVNMAAAGASELVVDASMHALSMDIAGKLSARAAQGIGVGLLTARLGIKAMALLRPLPWQKDKAVRLAEIRKQIVLRVVGKNK